jgi:3-oxoacyl-(acyl-carrier-protein) synthase III
VEKGVATSDLATAAAKDMLARRGLTPDDIPVIIVGTVTPDTVFPATACRVQEKLGASRAWGFDLSAACCGFVYALTTGAQLVASGAHDRALVIGADVMSSIIDYTDRTTCILFGDGATRTERLASSLGTGQEPYSWKLLKTVRGGSSISTTGWMVPEESIYTCLEAAA